MSFTLRLTLNLFLYLALLPCVSGFTRGDLQPDLSTFEQQVKPVLLRYCVRCHGGEVTKAKIRFDNIDPNIVSGEHFGKWEDVREAFNSGEMPPEDQPQPTDTERDVITGWLDAWEKSHNLAPDNPNDALRTVRAGESSDDRHLGYSYIESYINERADRLVP